MLTEPQRPGALAGVLTAPHSLPLGPGPPLSQAPQEAGPGRGEEEPWCREARAPGDRRASLGPPRPPSGQRKAADAGPLSVSGGQLPRSPEATASSSPGVGGNQARVNEGHHSGEEGSSKSSSRATHGPPSPTQLQAHSCLQGKHLHL